MEVGTEISQKIRSAIKAKLMEIGSYVDDELPDYIMVMVANKKTRQQMASDLSLFLGANTDIFTTWLHSLLLKLHTVSGDSSKTESSKVSKADKKKKTKEGGESKKEKRKVSKLGEGDCEDAPKAKSARTDTSITESNGTDEAHQLKDAGSVSNRSNLNQSSDKTIEHSKTVDEDSTQDDVEDVRQLLVTETQSDELAEELEKSEGIDPDLEKSSSSSNAVKTLGLLKSKKVANEPEQQSDQEPEAEAISTRKRRCPSSVVAAVMRDDMEDEDDQSSPMVASVVKVTSRKSSIPLSMQANSPTESRRKKKKLYYIQS